MTADVTFSFTTASPAPPVATNVIINEVDSDTPGADVAEFIELYDGGVGNTSLTGLVLVFFNGSNDLSYAAFDLDGFIDQRSGLFHDRQRRRARRGSDFRRQRVLQNGADAVALFAGNASDFPNNTAITTTNLQDAMVYDTDDADDSGLLVLLNAGQPQVNENGGGSGDHAVERPLSEWHGRRQQHVAYQQAVPSPGRTANACAPPPQPSNSLVVISQVYGGGGNARLHLPQ